MDRHYAIPIADRRVAAAGVAKVLASTAVVWMKTQGFSWNIEGRESIALGAVLSAQANELRRSLVPLSARIRALGVYAPAGLADLIALSPIAEERGVPVPREMARRLEDDHATVTGLIRCIRPALEDIEDNATCLVLDRRLYAHERAAAALAAIRRDCPLQGMLATSVREALVLVEPSEGSDIAP